MTIRMCAALYGRLRMAFRSIWSEMGEEGGGGGGGVLKGGPRPSPRPAAKINFSR